MGKVKQSLKKKKQLDTKKRLTIKGKMINSVILKLRTSVHKKT